MSVVNDQNNFMCMFYFIYKIVVLLLYSYKHTKKENKRKNKEKLKNIRFNKYKNT